MDMNREGKCFHCGDTFDVDDPGNVLGRNKNDDLQVEQFCSIECMCLENYEHG